MNSIEQHTESKNLDTGTRPSLSPVEDDEISLLDLALTVAETLRLLIIAPMVVGLAALGVGSFVPRPLRAKQCLMSRGIVGARSVPRGVVYCVAVSRYTSGVEQGRGQGAGYMRAERSGTRTWRAERWLTHSNRQS